MQRLKKMNAVKLSLHSVSDFYTMAYPSPLKPTLFYSGDRYVLEVPHYDSHAVSRVECKCHRADWFQGSVPLKWEQSDAKPNNDVSAAKLDSTNFATDSMGPMVEAAFQFVRLTGGIAVIGALGYALDFVGGPAGTRIVSENIYNRKNSNL